VDVSIIITSYNYSQYIEGCINSCLFQDNTKIKYEVIVVDDGSTDETPQILHKFKSKNLKKYRIENSGIEKASNFGLSKANGKFIVRVDADDQLLPTYLCEIEKYLALGFDFYYPNYAVIDSDDKLIKEVNLLKFDPKEILNRGDFLATGTIYSAKILNEYGYYSEQIKNSGLENYELILRLIRNQKIGKHISQTLFLYRRHDLNISKKQYKRILNNGNELFQKLGLGTYSFNKYHPYNPQEE
jgi:glycosyltransferase involved in cell wall biosynthesis